MVIWRILGDEIGPEGNGAAHFSTREEAERAVRAYKEWRKEQDRSAIVTGPEKMVIRNREELVNALDAAMGYGAS